MDQYAASYILDELLSGKSYLCFTPVCIHYIRNDSSLDDTISNASQSRFPLYLALGG